MFELNKDKIFKLFLSILTTSSLFTVSCRGKFDPVLLGYVTVYPASSEESAQESSYDESKHESSYDEWLDIDTDKCCVVQ